MLISQSTVYSTSLILINCCNRLVYHTYTFSMDNLQELFYHIFCSISINHMNHLFYDTFKKAKLYESISF